MDILGFKSVSALRKAVKNGDSSALEFLELLNEFLKGGIKSEDITVRGKLDFLNYMNIQIGYLKHEEFKAIFLNSSNQIVLNETLFCGTIDRSVVYPRVIIEKAILSKAKGVIFMHNHLTPSKKDIELTLEMQELLDKVDVKLLDHYIISETENFSFYENGLIDYL
ncbi:JAB domain-containing protein (plasmid) [Cetobacterium somerae]|uniref:JAB domain-containing protein n=1 Tax=Cetobacterium somerae TaxID=188913 RepID=UPI002E7B3030|nr:JAB domain-containing protein [Cetobacterium somerae]WVJ03417.1 JAB domain-containing protein [Cetobacterium somerae]